MILDDFDGVMDSSLDAMQRDSPSDLITQDLNDLPDDLLRLIAIKLSHVDQYGQGYVMGGMNALRLVSKRFMRVVKSCATWLTQLQYNGPESLPLVLKRCRRIEHIRCNSRNIRSLEGCPDGLKSLFIGQGESLENLEPLRGCTQLESFEIGFAFQITDLGPLHGCTRLKRLVLTYSKVAKISALASMPLLEDLIILVCCNIRSLDPLSGLKMLRSFEVQVIDPQTSVLPLSLCTSLKVLICSPNTVDLKELMKKMPGLQLSTDTTTMEFALKTR